MGAPFKLYRLQQIDTQLDRIRGRLAEIESALAEDQLLIQARQDLEQAAARLEREQKDLRRAEQESLDQRVKIEQTESTLYGGKVRSPKELQDLQNEVAALKRYRSVLEDRQFECMMAVEEAEEDHRRASTRLDEVQARFDQHHIDLVSERLSLLAELGHMETERAAAGSSISAEEMQLYEDLRRQRRGVAVAKVSDRSCSACGSMLSAALLSTARNLNQITRCTACGRILYAG